MERATTDVKVSMVARLAPPGRRLLALLLDQLYPPACSGCAAPLAKGDSLCAACFARLAPISAPYCPVLGTPFEADFGEGIISLEATRSPPPYRRARAALRYNDFAGTLISRLKYGDHTELAKFCARLMAHAGAEFWAAQPVLIPVPLHRKRLHFRRYNQSLLLAQALGKALALPVDPFLVRRKRNTRQQVGLSGHSRLKNVEGAFAAHPHTLARLAGRPLVIIDDVYTTGATINAVTRALKRGGATEIDVLTFARVVIGQDNPI